MSRKIKTLATALMMLLAGNCLNAQDVQQKPRNNEIAIDVAPIFRVNNFSFTTPTLNLMYRHYFGNAALRIKMNALVSSNAGDNSNDNGSGTETTNKGKSGSQSLDIRAGWQWNKLVNEKNLYFYFGADLIYQRDAFVSNSENVYKNTFNTTTSIVDTKSSSTGLGLAPVLGLNLRLTRAFSIGIENSFAGILTVGKASSETHNTTVDNDGNIVTENRGKGENKSASFNINVDPIKNLSVFMSFHF